MIPKKESWAIEPAILARQIYELITRLLAISIKIGCVCLFFNFILKKKWEEMSF